MRCFIAIAVPKTIKAQAALVQRGLSKLPMACKFVELENIHINLSFLGEIDSERIKEVCAILDSICNRYEKFEADVRNIKMIPSPSYIRVLAFDVVSDENEIKRLSADIKRLVGGKVKPPHLTLCRVKAINNKSDVVSGISKFENAVLGRFVVNSVYLMKSELKRTGPIYTKLHESKLL